MRNWLAVHSGPDMKIVKYIDLNKATVIEHHAEEERFIVYFDPFDGSNGIVVERQFNEGVYRKIKELVGDC
jgi:hypothetical protein